MFEYIKNDTIGLEDKVKNLWNYYKDDIENWSTSFSGIIDKYYLTDDNKLANKVENISIDNVHEYKNIEKMIEYYKKEILDPINMMLFINSVAEKNRGEIVKQLAADTQNAKKEFRFFGVPHYQQMPGIGDFNKDATTKIDKLWELSKLLVNKPEVSYDNEELENSLQNVCKEFCKNGIAKITSALYYLRPDFFIPLNKYTADLFKNVPDKYNDNFVKQYLKLCKGIKDDEKLLKEQDKDLKLFPVLSAFTMFSNNIIGETIANYKNTKNIILTGAPGNGKTYSVKKYLKEKLGENYDDQVCFVQFHPNFEYSDFIDGIKPSNVHNGNLTVELQNGIFKEFCKKAFKDPKKNFYFVIDEINRADLSSVFGEILNTLEYRIKFDESNKITNPEDFILTQNSHLVEKLDEDMKKELSVCEEYPGKFGIPENVYILATMNDVDRSIDSFDLALRRRFIWIEMAFDENVLRFEVKEEPEVLIDKAKKLNTKISEFLGSSSYEIGHAYFLNISHYEEADNRYELLWSYHLEPLIREYLRADYAESEISKKLEEMKKEFIGN